MLGHVVYENIGNDWETDVSGETEPGTPIGLREEGARISKTCFVN